jgi:hypothetical protein
MVAWMGGGGRGTVSREEQVGTLVRAQKAPCVMGVGVNICKNTTCVAAIVLPYMFGLGPARYMSHNAMNSTWC